MLKLIPVVLILIQSIGNLHAQKKQVTANTNAISLSAIKGTSSRTDRLIVMSSKRTPISDFKITGEHSSYFKFTSLTTDQKPKATKLILQFTPPSTFVGIARATVASKDAKLSMALFGLAQMVWKEKMNLRCQPSWRV
jgi:hypothetical protein